MKKYIAVVCLLFIIIACNQDNKKHIKALVSEWSNKEIIFPKNLLCTKNLYDTISYDIKSKLKVFYYVDSAGCSSCKLRLSEWREFKKEFKTIANSDCELLIVFEPKDKMIIRDISTRIRTSGIDNIFVLDTCNSFNKLNNFPNDDQFHCFLLDENNHIIIIGNPVQSSKIKDLYISTICEKLGVKQPNDNTESIATNTYDFGIFPYTETKATNFMLKNSSNKEMSIDSVFTSCECTTAETDKTTIKPQGYATISVVFKTDKPETFIREVYIKTNEETHVFTISGEAK